MIFSLCLANTPQRRWPDGFDAPTSQSDSTSLSSVCDEFWINLVSYE